MRVLLWRVHDPWTSAFLQGAHDVLVPVLPDGGAADCGGVAAAARPGRAREVAVEQLREEPVDAVILQRPHELGLAEEWLGRRPGRDVPALYLEHHAPTGPAATTRHPLAYQAAIPIVHVSAAHRLRWDAGQAPTHVVPCGVPDPGHRWTGGLERAAVVADAPGRCDRAVGADLLPGLVRAAPVDVLGPGVSALLDPDGPLGAALAPAAASGRLGLRDDLPHDRLLVELARRRVFVDLARRTSLGLPLAEAMLLGMPVVALATTEAAAAVPPGCGVLAVDRTVLHGAVRRYLRDPGLAADHGRAARAHALEAFGLQRFLDDWDALLDAYA